MAAGLRLEDWIGKWVTDNLHRGAVADPDDALVSVEGFLEGVGPMGVIVLFSPRDVAGRGGPAHPPPSMPPRYVFYPWRRVELVERIEDENE